MYSGPHVASGSDPVQKKYDGQKNGVAERIKQHESPFPAVQRAWWLSDEAYYTTGLEKYTSRAAIRAAASCTDLSQPILCTGIPF